MTEKIEVHCNFLSTTRYERRGRRHSFNVSPSGARILGGEGGLSGRGCVQDLELFFGKRGTFATVVKKNALYKDWMLMVCLREVHFRVNLT